MAVHLSLEEKKDMRAAIRALAFYCGATPFDTDDAPVIAIERFMANKFPKARAEHLIEAFEMAAAKELVSNGKPLDMRKSLSFGMTVHIELVGEVMAAYVEFKRQRKSLNDMANYKRPDQDERFIPTPEYHLENLMGHCKADRKLPVVHSWESIHGLLVSRGKLAAIAKPRPQRRRDLGPRPVFEDAKTDPYRLAIKALFIREGLIDHDQD